MMTKDSPRSSFDAKAYFVAKSIARRARWLPHDLSKKIKGGNPLEPPRGISFVGHGDFEKIGRWYVSQFEAAGLKANGRVLDMACGVGRMAIPLMDSFEIGSYDGFDTSGTMIRWCQRQITSRDPRFTFSHAPIHNRKYNPFGGVWATEYRFPYADDSFDFAFATSLFTHLGIEETSHYLSELRRVLKPDGTALITFFLIGGEGRPVDGRSDGFDFAYDFGPLKTINPKEPEAAVAYPEQLLMEAMDVAGLVLAQPITYGRWPQESVGHDIQDRLVVKPVS